MIVVKNGAVYVESDLALYFIEPLRFVLDLSRTEVVRHHIVQQATEGWKSRPPRASDINALLDAYAEFVTAERRG